MVWVYDRTESLPLAMLMHAPISATTLVLASMASPGNAGIAVLFPVLGWGAAFWVIVVAVTVANGGRLAAAPPKVRGALRHP
jgi:hypothetical protein